MQHRLTVSFVTGEPCTVHCFWLNVLALCWYL